MATPPGSTSFRVRGRRPLGWVLAFALASGSLWAGACGDGGTDPSEILSAIRLSAPNATIHVGETLDLVATVLNGNGDPVTTAPPEILWASSDPSIAEVSSAGAVTGIAAGTATITASVGSVSASVVVDVVQVVSDVVALNAEDLHGSVGDPLQDPVRVRLTDPDGKGVPGIPVFYTVLTGGGVASPTQNVTGSDGASTTEWVLGPVAGVQQLEVRVVLDGASTTAAFASDNQDLVIVLEAEAQADPPAGIAVTPADQTLMVGEEGSVQGAVVDQFGNPIADQTGFTISWSSSDPGVASVAASGAVTAAAVGAAAITGTVVGDPSLVGQANVTVVRGDPAGIAVVSGDGQIGGPGIALPAPLVVLVTNGSGAPVPDESVTWTVAGGTATLSAGSSDTDASGQAMVSVTLGETLGPVQITASVAGAGSASFGATVVAGPVITTTSMPSGTVGVAYSQTLSASGGNGIYTWALVNGTTLPGGLSLNGATGQISGTPTAAGTTNFEVQATSAGATATKALGMTVVAPPQITTTSLPDGTVGEAYGQKLAAGGGDGSYTWDLVNGTTLPDGLSLNRATGRIHGTPTVPGKTNFTVQVTSGGATATTALSITVLGAPVITTTSLPGGVVGEGYSQTLAAAGGDGTYAWAMFSGTTLPANLSLQASTGKISGTPAAAGTTNFEVEVTSSGVTATKALSITVLPAPVITTTSLPGGVVGEAYSQTLAASGGDGTYTWAMFNGTTLPANLSLDAATGVIHGTPAAAGTTNFQVEVTSAGVTATKALSITITAPPASVVGFDLEDESYMSIEVEWYEVDDGLGSPASYVLRYGSPTIDWSSASSTEVSVSGTTVGTYRTQVFGGLQSDTDYQFQIRAYRGTLGVDAVFGPLSNVLPARTAPPPTAPTITTTSPLTHGSVNVGYSRTLAAKDGDGSYTWALFNGTTLPAGLTLNAGMGVISGTPQAAGTTDFDVEVTSAGLTGTKALQITIDPVGSPTIVDTGIRPVSATLNIGETKQFNAVSVMSDGSEQAASATWSATGGTITSGGSYTGGSVAGSFQVVATQGAGQADTAQVTILPPPPTITAIDVRPSAVTLVAAGGRQFSAVALMSDGSEQSAPVTWSATGGTITTGGFYTAPITSGTYSVTATHTPTGFTDNASVTVQSSGGGGGTALSVCTVTAPAIPGATRTFYVNAQSGDDNAAGTTPSTAWRTLGKANATAQPGDLFLLRGTFSNQVIHPTTSGTASAKIVYMEDPAGTAIVETGQYDVIVWLDGVSHVVVDGIELRNANIPIYITGGGNNWLRNLWVHDLSSNEILGSSDNRIENSVIEACGSASANAGECVWIADGAHRNVIANNTILNGGHGLVGIGGDKASMAVSNDNRVVLNDLANPWASNVLIYGPGQRTVVECNQIHNTSTSGINYARTGLQINGKDNVVRFNEIFDNASDGIQIQGYAFQGLLQNATGNQIYHNTIYNNGGAGLEILQKEGDASNNVIQNNIFWGNNTTSQRTFGGEKWDIWIDLYNALQVWPQGSLNGNVIRNNIMATSAADSGGGWMIVVRSAGNLQYTLAQAESAFSGVSGNLEADPLFVNAGSGDFRLQSGSPAIDAGVSISGISFLGSAPDLGAHEAH